jgi:hypothetical protein
MAGQRNEGEGNRTAARRYNKDQQEFVKSGRVEKAARDAEQAMRGKEREELERASKEGAKRAKDHDPEEQRNYRK